MKLSEIKKSLLQACLDHIDEKIHSLQKVMDEAQQSANEYGQPKDRYDSYRAQLLRKRDMFGQQLMKILEQRSILEKINPDKVSDTVGFGTLVITNKQAIFVSVGLGKLQCEDIEFFVISPTVPYYKAMEGKKIGDSYEFREQRFTITDIA
jgi:isochorismate hydrolase